MEVIKQVSFRVTDEEHAKLKAKVAKEKTTIQDVLNEFVLDYLSESDGEILAVQVLNECSKRAYALAEDLEAMKKLRLWSVPDSVKKKE